MNEQVAPLPREVSVAVIGAGTMGSGIALVAATAGHSVLIYDGAPGAAEAVANGSAPILSGLSRAAS